MTTNNDMITRCPQCATAFRVTQELLSIANGTVRCGSCLSVFKAEEYFINSDTAPTPEETPNTAKNTDNSTTKAADKSSVKKPKSGIGKKLRNLINNDEDDILIHDDLHSHKDDNRSIEDQSNNVFNFQNKGFHLKANNSSNHFESNEVDTNHSTREKTDESWAMDLLAEIEDDEIQPINIKRPKKVELEPTAKNTKPLKKTIPPNTRDEIKAASMPTTPEHRDNDEPNIDTLIDQETVYESADAIIATKDDNVLLTAEIDDAAAISDEEIENAMHHKTTYASGNASIMGGVESDSIDMEWSESPRKRHWLWFTGIIIMALLLGLQVAWLRFDTLSKQPSYRPYYTKVCQVLGCELAKLIDINRIRANNLVVRSHPEKSNALIVDVILVNTADFEQPYPALRLEFSGINGESIANRNFQPREYLKGELAGSQIMKNNQPIQLSLELVDPGETAVNYRITAISAKSTN